MATMSAEIESQSVWQGQASDCSPLLLRDTTAE
jgi:hypothetical protein